MGANTDLLRQELMGRVDALLGRPLLIWGRDRQLLSALRGYLAVMPDTELERLQTYLARHAPEPAAPKAGEGEA